MNIEGKPMLQRVIDRAKLSNVDEVALAIPNTPENDVLKGFDNLPYYQGSEYDVLSRFCGAITAFKAAVTVRVTADCPLLDPEVINWLLRDYKKNNSTHYISSKGLPNGIGAEVFPKWVLDVANREATQPYEREHVTPYLHEHNRYICHRLESGVRLHRPDIRLSVDTPEDLEFVRAVYKYFSPREIFSTEEVIGFLDSHPEIKAINAHVKQKGLGE
jgi:spore coat polysaccharide biosynthesis protein SpsF (cytidylyltransferase family)